MINQRLELSIAMAEMRLRMCSEPRNRKNQVAQEDPRTINPNPKYHPENYSTNNPRKNQNYN